ncbi:MAG: hypothetical protein FJX72_04915 [Armatimonadetes bacterium]|nr:hypothetical protein [Armatimonadota bacterium]
MHLLLVLASLCQPMPAQGHQLFVDRSMVAEMKGAELRLHRPEPREVALRFDAPWEGKESGYVTVMRDHEGRFRMYYRGGGEPSREVACVAFSDDGITWTKPTLGLFDHAGSKANNIVFVGREPSYWETHNFTPFLDANPNAPAEARYKAIGLGRAYPPVTPDRQKALVALGSPDGIRWRPLSDKAIIWDGSFDSQNVAFWDTLRREYVCYLRAGSDGIRSVKRATSKDFLTWTAAEWLDFGPGEPEHFYTNAIAPYFRDPSLYLGFPMRFIPERKAVGSTKRPTDGVSDAVLISSRDGLRFDRTFREAFIRPGLSQANWGDAHGNNTPAWGILQTGPDEISIYWSENYGGTPHVRRGALRLDGFVSVYAPASGGEMITKPIRCTGPILKLNYSTSAAGGIRCEVQDAGGTPIEGLTLGDSIELFGDEMAGTLAWKNGTPLGALVGKAIRLRFVMRDADLYSVRFGEL